MKKKLLFVLGMILLYPFQSDAITYNLAYSIDKNHQHGSKGSKAPARRPLCIDVTNNIFTVPERLIGYTLIISNEEETYTYYITSNIFSIPESLDGYYDITFTNGNVSYQREIKF